MTNLPYVIQKLKDLAYNPRGMLSDAAKAEALLLSEQLEMVLNDASPELCAMMGWSKLI